MATKLERMQEAERRGILPQHLVERLTEARKRGLIPSQAIEQPIEQPIAVEAPQEPTKEPIFGSLGEDLSKRGAEIGKIYRGGYPEQNPLEDIGQILGQVGRGAGEIVGETVSRFVGNIDKDLAGGAGSEYVKGKMQEIANTEGGQDALKAMQGGIESYQAWAKENPRFARNVSAVTGIIELIPAISGGKAAVKSSIEGVKAIGELATPTAKAAGRYGSAVKRGATLPPIKPTQTADELRSLASAKYTEAAAKGGVIKETTVDKFLDKVVADVMPQTKVGQSLAGKSEVAKIMDDLSTNIRGKQISLDEAQDIDEYLSEAIDGFIEMGRPTKQGKKLIQVQDSFRKSIENAVEGDIVGGMEGFKALKDARGLWHKASKMSDVERIITRAEMMDNPATGIKTGFRTLFNNPNRIKGFNKAERAAIEKAANSGVVGDLLKMGGSRLVSIIAAGSGAGVLPVAGAVAGGLIARGGAGALQTKRALDVARTISTGKPQSALKRLANRGRGISREVKKQAEKDLGRSGLSKLANEI